MQLSRLVLDGSKSGPPLEVHFDPDIAILPHNGTDATRVRLALESLFQGSTGFGQAYLRIDGLEIDVTAELATHLAHHIGPRGRILEAGFAGEGEPDDDRSASIGAVVLRAALEMLRMTEGRLGPPVVERALHAVLAERRTLRSEAELACAEAAGRQAEARAALDKLEAWRASVEPLHDRSVEARRRLSRPLSYRKYAKHKAEEMELLGAGDFESYEEFIGYAEEATDHHRRELEAADEALAEAGIVRDALAAGSSGHPRSDLLTVKEFILRLRNATFASHEDLSRADDQSLRNALGVLMDLEYGGRHSSGDQLLDQAMDSLTRIESERLRAELGRQASAHADSLPAVGTVPLVLDAPLADVEPSSADRALTSLDPFIGLVQMVVLRPDPSVVRWAATHAREADPRPGPPIASPIDSARPPKRPGPTRDRRATGTGGPGDGSFGVL